MFKRLFNKIVEARTESARRKIARLQLYSMTDKELQDLGINRYDIEKSVLTGRAICKKQVVVLMILGVLWEEARGPSNNNRWSYRSVQCFEERFPIRKRS